MDPISGSAAMPVALNVAGTVLGAQGTLAKGDAAVQAAERRRTAADYQATQLDQNGGQAIAASQRGAEDERRQAALVASRALAVAAASGGGASDGSVQHVISRIAGEGQYRSMLDLYAGEDKARVMRMQGEALRYDADLGMADARNAQKISRFAAATTMLSGAARTPTLFSKYGQGAPASLTSGAIGGQFMDVDS